MISFINTNIEFYDNKTMHYIFLLCDKYSLSFINSKRIDRKNPKPVILKDKESATIL